MNARKLDDQPPEPAPGPIIRTVQILEAFAARPTWGVRELAARLGLPKSGVHRALQEFANAGLLVVEDDGAYRYGPGLLRFAARLSAGADLVGVAAPHLGAARDATGETVILTVYDSGRAQFAAVSAAESRNPIRYIWQSLEDWSDLHLGSSGLGILAFLPERERRSIVATLPDPVPGLSSISKLDLEAELDRVRARGFAASVGGRFPGARGVCAPVRDATGTVIGGVVIGWPDRAGAEADEVQAERGETAAATAHEISVALGWDGASTLD